MTGLVAILITFQVTFVSCYIAYKKKPVNSSGSMSDMDMLKAVDYVYSNYFYGDIDKEALEEAYFDYKDEVELGEESKLNEEQHDELNESVVNDDDEDALYEEDDITRENITIDLESDKPKQTLFEAMDAVRKEQIKNQSGLRK